MRRCTRRPIARLLLTALLAAPAARAEIAGEQVVSGTASFEQSGNVLTITASDGAIIQYSQFGVLASEQMHFVQPSSDARVLNRVFGDATHIDGGLSANGIVYIVNPAGVFFGPFAVVDVGGLYAAAGDIGNEDFLARIDRFTLSGTALNAGSIESPAVALLGTAVANHGNIHAPDGTIALVAGEKVLLTQLGAHIAVQVEGAAGSAQAPALEQAGSVDAGAGGVSFVTGDVYSLAINHTGITRGRDIELRAGSGTVQVAGTLDASDRSAGGTGGGITVTGERVALVGTQLDASGDAGGGSIRVGGDLRGGDALPTARRTYVDEASALRADAIASGDGGRVIVWADEATAFHGTVSARGGAARGDGGFAEISGAALAADGEVDLSAPAGAAGTLLYDPTDIVIHGGPATTSPEPDDSDDSGTTLTGSQLGRVLFGDVADLDEPFDIYESEIEGTDANIVLEARNSITATAASTFVNDAPAPGYEGDGVVLISDGRSLTMRTRNNTADTGTAPGIHLGGVSFETSGVGAITLATGNDGAGGGGTRTDAADIEVGDLTTAGGDVTVSTRNGSIRVDDVTTSGADGTTGGAAGDISLLAGDSDSDALGDSDVTITGDLIARGGAATTGAGGAGGTVRVRSDGVLTTPFPTGSTQQVTAGGGDLLLQNDVDTSGGESDQGAGGAGGNVRIETTDGAIDARDITTSGGDGGTTGGRAGSILLLTRDANGDNAGASIDVDALTAVGGEGEQGAGGAGAFIDARTQARLRVVQTNPPTDPLPDPPVVLQEAQGGGSVRIASADASGGDGGTTGGNAGAEGGGSTLAIRVTAAGAGNDVTTGTLSAHGGDGQGGNGGAGRDVSLTAEDGDVSAGAIDSSGGEGQNAADTALGGRGGTVTLTAGSAEDAGARDITLGGQIDAREGESEADVTTAVDGGFVTLDASGSIEHTGVPDPQIRAGGNVSLTAGANIGHGDPDPLEVEGGGEAGDFLTVRAGGRADVDVRNTGFLGGLFVIATTVAANIEVDQAGNNGGNEIRMAGSGGRMVVTDVDTRDGQVGIGSVALINEDDDAPDGTLVLATGSVDAARTFQAFSDGDLVVGTTDGVVIQSARKDPGALDDPIDPGSVFLFADNDDDGVGALLDAAGAAVTGVIDMRGDVTDPGELGELALLAGGIDTAGDPNGIGTASEPITVSGGARIAAVVVPREEDPDNDGEFILDPLASAGIYLRNQDNGDLEIIRGSQATGISIAAGTGDVVVDNRAGGITVASALRSKPLTDEDGTSFGTGGDVTVRVAPDSQIVLDASRFSDALAIGSGGTMTFDGDVVLARATELEADGGLVIQGSLDTSDDASDPVGFTATVEGGATSRIDGSIGESSALRSFTLSSPDAAPSTLRLGGTLVRTTEAQTYGANLTLTQPVILEAGTRIVFDGTASQTVTGSAGRFTLDAGGSAAAIPSEATIAKPNGSLTLASPGGSVIIGDGDKLSVAGTLTLSGDTVRFTDLSALDITVTSPDAQVFARSPGVVAAPSGDPLVDGGTDLIANTVAFSTAPTAVGGGPTPRIATASGTAQNPGVLGVSVLPGPIAAADIASGSRVLDLALPSLDPGHETLEISSAPLAPPIEMKPSQDRAAPAPPVSREEIAAFFACAPVGNATTPPTGCSAAAPPPAYGSALDTERAVEIARAYRDLLGDSPSAVAGREALARAAADPKAPLGSATSPAGRVYLTEIARVLAQVRLLGLGERYREVRADVLAGVAAAIGSRELDAARLGAAVDARAMGMAI